MSQLFCFWISFAKNDTTLICSAGQSLFGCGQGILLNLGDRLHDADALRSVEAPQIILRFGEKRKLPCHDRSTSSAAAISSGAMPRSAYTSSADRKPASWFAVKRAIASAMSTMSASTSDRYAYSSGVVMTR